MSGRARILASIAVAVTVFISASVATTLRPVTYSAEAEIAIVPRVTDDAAPIEAADTISRGTVVDTYAQVYGTTRTRDAAAAELEGPPVDASNVQVTAVAVAGTSIVRITAVADDPATAELVADAIATYETNLGGFSRAFRTQVIEAAAGSAGASGPSRSLLYVAAAIAGIAIGALTFVALGRLAGPRPGPEWPEPAPRTNHPPVDPGPPPHSHPTPPRRQDQMPTATGPGQRPQQDPQPEPRTRPSRAPAP